LSLQTKEAIDEIPLEMKT